MSREFPSHRWRISRFHLFGSRPENERPYRSTIPGFRGRACRTNKANWQRGSGLSNLTPDIRPLDFRAKQSQFELNDMEGK